MIWFGNVAGLAPLTPLHPTRPHRTAVRDRDRMRQALEWVASRAPQLEGRALVQALAETGCVDEATALRLLPEFRSFDADRHFAQHLRNLSYRGAGVLGDFRAGVARAVEDALGNARLEPFATHEGVCFSSQGVEGVVLAFAEVNFSISGSTAEAVLAAAEAMPDALVIVARSFHPGAEGQLSSLLQGREVPGTLTTLNLLLGIRAMALRYHPAPLRVAELLGTGRPLRSADVATLGTPVAAAAAA